MNYAAKDDFLCNWDGTLSLSQLLANDPGSAHNVTLGNGATFGPVPGMILVGDVTSFTYTEQLANGTYSTATVQLMTPTVSGVELLSNASFEQDQTTTGGDFSTQDSLPGWTTVSGSA